LNRNCIQTENNIEFRYTHKLKNKRLQYIILLLESLVLKFFCLNVFFCFLFIDVLSVSLSFSRFLFLFEHYLIVLVCIYWGETKPSSSIFEFINFIFYFCNRFFINFEKKFFILCYFFHFQFALRYRQ
jgi:hypothetical protein